MSSLKPKGKLAVIGGDFKQLNDTMFKGVFYRIFRKKKAISIMSKSSVETLKEIKQLAESGHLNQLIGCTYPLEEVRQAYIDFNEGKFVGKYIIEMPTSNPKG